MCPHPRGFSLGSSPLTRGARYAVQRLGPADGIIPAHAGSTVVMGGVPMFLVKRRGAWMGVLVPGWVLGRAPCF